MKAIGIVKLRIDSSSGGRSYDRKTLIIDGMDEDMDGRRQISGVCDGEILGYKVANLSKKRKFLAEAAEHLGLPESKQKCYDPTLSSECDSSFTKSLEAEDFHIHISKGKCIAEATDMEATDMDLEVNSAQDSNSFVTGVCSEIKLDTDDIKSHSSDEASTSWSFCGQERIRNVHSSLEGGRMLNSILLNKELTSTSRDAHPIFQGAIFHGAKNIEEQHPQHGNNWEYICSGETDDELEDFVYSKAANPNLHMVSSDIWNVNQETQLGSRTPTIDQEFEQYFSALML
ncbi:hypothetical protein Nepgr_030781 [Nepenthes gracilis]|uniref:Uncharacterized protein n=1 Tax=Nepenthes gracilis TaxID=150966 RepID=A0AAD3TFE7_NEPGR|nr:hypothetical protein Nepgr_030781 [Nepenthes gracilis]